MDATDIGAFTELKAKLLRWGWSVLDAERTAERLVQRDRGGDDRRVCVECQHYRPGRCDNHRAAGPHTADIGRDLAELLQRCPGYAAVESPASAGQPDQDAGNLATSGPSSVAHRHPARREGPGEPVSRPVAPRSAGTAT